jgi:RND family efflux transporter MFP subunit
MKHILTILTITLLLTSCGKEQTQSTESIIEAGNVEALRTKKTALTTQAATIKDELAQIEKAIETLDPAAKKEVLVTTAVVKDTLFNHFVEIQGSVETKQNVLVYPEYQGTLLQVNVKKGQRVSKGQTLARIDDGGLGSQVAQLETQAALAQTTFERQERLWNQKIGSEIQFLQAKTQYESAQNMVKQMKSQLGRTVVKAPFSGVIDDVITEQGTVVAPGMALFRIVNLSNMYVSAEVPETYLKTISKGKNVSVYFPVLDETIETTIRQSGDYINPSNRSFPIEIDVPNKKGSIKPNLTARLSINDYTAENAILIPLNVINENAAGEQYVYTAFAKAEDNTIVAKQQIITTGLSQGDKIEVVSGLKPGDKIIVEGARSVKDDQEVRILTY